MATGFIGLGTMGLPMANRLEQRGFELLGWDTNPQAAINFGAGASSLQELAGQCDVFITMLPEGEHVRAVYDQLTAAGITENCLFIDCSTIDIATTRDLAAELAQRGHGFVDAPVSGGCEAAAAGGLSFMIGGDGAAVDCARPWLEAMGDKLNEFGAAGAGQAVAETSVVKSAKESGSGERFMLRSLAGGSRPSREPRSERDRRHAAPRTRPAASSSATTLCWMIVILLARTRLRSSKWRHRTTEA